jgi:Transposase DDE domain group 1
LRQSVYSRLAGYEDVNDAERLSVDPAFRLIASPKIWDRGAALTSTLHWFETGLLTREENLVGLMAVNREVLAQAAMHDGADRVVLDMDSSESPVHGQQEGSAYNGHFESVCYHPLFLFNDRGDCLAAKLRPGKSRAPTTGMSCSSPKSSASRRKASTSPFAPMPRLPSQKSMKL